MSLEVAHCAPVETTQTTPETPWIGPEEAAALLGVGTKLVRAWADSGELRGMRTPGGHRRFLRDDVVAFRDELLDAHRQERSA